MDAACDGKCEGSPAHVEYLISRSPFEFSNGSFEKQSAADYDNRILGSHKLSLMTNEGSRELAAMPYASPGDCSNAGARDSVPCHFEDSDSFRTNLSSSPADRREPWLLVQLPREVSLTFSFLSSVKAVPRRCSYDQT
jgi:hypothetical protein